MTYKYRFLARPMSSDTCPNDNFIAFHNDDEYRRHGIVEYSKPLTIQQAKHYDLAPLFLQDYEGKTIIYFEDFTGTISLTNNHAGQLFFKVSSQDDETVIVWHEFIANIENGRYKLVGKELEPVTCS